MTEKMTEMGKAQPKKLCALGRGRSATAQSGMVCEDHQAAWDAEYLTNAWAIAAEEILPQFVGLAHLFGNDPVEEMMRENLERAKREATRWDAEDARLSVRPNSK